MALIEFDRLRAEEIYLKCIQDCSTYDDLINALNSELVDFMNKSFALLIDLSVPKIITLNNNKIILCGVAKFHKNVGRLNQINLKICDSYCLCDYQRVKKLLKNFNLTKFWMNSHHRRQAFHSNIIPKKYSLTDKIGTCCVCMKENEKMYEILKCHHNELCRNCTDELMKDDNLECPICLTLH